LETFIADFIEFDFTKIRDTIKPKKETDYHIISSGDTLSKIAKNYNLSLEEIIENNNLNNPNNVSIGDKIYIKTRNKNPNNVAPVINPSNCLLISNLL